MHWVVVLRQVVARSAGDGVDVEIVLVDNLFLGPPLVVFEGEGRGGCFSVARVKGASKRGPAAPEVRQLFRWRCFSS